MRRWNWRVAAYYWAGGIAVYASVVIFGMSWLAAMCGVAVGAVLHAWRERSTA